MIAKTMTTQSGVTVRIFTDMMDADREAAIERMNRTAVQIAIEIEKRKEGKA